MKNEIVKFAEKHPLWFVGLALGAGILLTLGGTAFDAGVKEFFRWIGGWPR